MNIVSTEKEEPDDHHCERVLIAAADKRSSADDDTIKTLSIEAGNSSADDIIVKMKGPVTGDDGRNAGSSNEGIGSPNDITPVDLESVQTCDQESKEPPMDMEQDLIMVVTNETVDNDDEERSVRLPKMSWLGTELCMMYLLASACIVFALVLCMCTICRWFVSRFMCFAFYQCVFAII
jgi:hypothetical protein